MKTPRYYQTAAHEAIRAAYKRGLKRVMIELATGLGKTVIFVLMALMAKAKGGKVLILVNRDVLVSQALEELRINGVFAQREQAEERASLTADVVVGSIQSMQSKWLTKWPRDHFKLVITDECHGSAARTFRVILDHFESAYHCGVTATAERHDRKGLWKGFEDIVYRMPLNNWEDKETGEVTLGGIDDGWLCPFDFHELDCPVVLDEKLMTHAIIKENEEVFDSHKYLPRLAECAAAESNGRKGLFFFPNCRVSNEMTVMLKERGLNAEHIDSSYMPPHETKRLLEWFAAQESGILCNADLLSVGYNQPDINMIGLFRPIASNPMYKQRLGRGTRPIASVDLFATADERRAAIASSAKPACKVLNVFWENGSHDLASPSCLITDDADERKELDQKRRPGQNVNLAQLELQLKAKRMDDKEEEKRKFAEKVANSQEKKRRNAPFIGHILRMKHNGNDASSGQMFYLRKLGYKHEGPGLSKQQAFLITETYKRQRVNAV